MLIKNQCKGIIATISPALLTKILFYIKFKKKLNLKNPQTINEKISWLKLNTYNNNPLVTQCADKLKVRDYVKYKGCSEILNNLLGVWDHVDEINWETLPNSFVLKCNHGCKYNILCPDKNELDIKMTKDKLEHWLKEDYWKLFAEVQYKGIEKKIICEEFLKNDNQESLTDYKFYCVNGKVETLVVCLDRWQNHGHAIEVNFDKNWNYLPTREQTETNYLNGKMPNKPSTFNKMLQYSEILSEPFPIVRVDFYEVNGKVIFSELTFTSAGGMDAPLEELPVKIGESLVIGNG